VEPEIYRAMAALEESHWWFCSRRVIVRSLIERLKLPPEAVIFEPGCGTGGNFAMLSEFGRVYAMDTDPDACAVARAKGLATVERGELPDGIPFGDLKADLIVMTDVLEHLDQDRESLEALRSRLRDGGHFIATVPAMPWLWSEYDVALHHRRRYTAPVLRSLLEITGYQIELLTHYNFILFPAIVAARMVERLMLPHSRPSVLTRHHPLVNSILLRLFSSERYVIDRVRVPIGTSLLVVARR
jgi:SAM-dependent methyltransferase